MSGNEPKRIATPDAAQAMGVFTTDTSLTIRTWDPWLAAAAGIPAEDACGRRVTEVIPDIESRGLLAPFQRVIADGVVEVLAPAFHRYLLECPSGVATGTLDRMQQRVTIGPLREDGAIVGAMVAIEDVTSRVERERALAARLGDADPQVRLHAARQLADSEPLDAVDPLIPAIGDDNWRVRRAAVAGLARRKTTDVIAALLEALRADHRNFSVLSSAIELLASSESDVVEPLMAMLRHPDLDLRLQAALVLGQRGDPRAIGPLIEVLSDPDDNFRFHAIEALGKLKAAEAVDRLAAIAEEGNFFLGFAALEAIALIEDGSVAPRLAPLMANDLLRGTVAEVLGRIGDEDAVGPLVQGLNDATAPTDVVAGALAAVHERYETRYRDGEHIEDLVRRLISPTGTQNLLDAVQRATAEQLPAVTRVLGWLEGRAVERALTRLLGQPSVRGKVVESLVRYGPRVVDLLIEQLGAEDLDTRHAAIVGLGRIGDRRATLPLIDLLSRDPASIVVTAGALARLGDARAFETLIALIGHPDAAVRQAVIAALNSIGHPDMARRLGPLLSDPDSHVRESAVRIAGYFGYDECAEAILRCCDDPDPTVQRAALGHLAYLNDDRVAGRLMDALGPGGAPGLRSTAVQALARLDDPRAVPPLVAALRDPDAWVRYFAARGLGERRESGALDDLARLAFDDPAGQVRLAAIAAIGRSASVSAVPALAALASSDDLDVAAAALEALGETRRSDALPPLHAALRHGDDGRRAAAARAIGRLDTPAAVDLLEWAAAADVSAAVVSAAVDALAALAADAGSAAGAVKALIALSADPARQEPVIAAIGRLPAAQIDDIAHGLRDPRPSVRVAILRALARMRQAGASRWLQTGLNDEAPEVRLAALTALRHLGTRGVDRHVITLAHSDPDAAVRRAAMAFLKGAV